MKLTALIIDDEYLARRRVEKLLESHPGVTVLGEAKNGQEAVKLIRHKSPDLIFLDVEMPDFGGFEVIRRLGQHTVIPYLIFTTAYDQYAIEAFAVDAIDYLHSFLPRHIRSSASDSSWLIDARPNAPIAPRATHAAGNSSLWLSSMPSTSNE